MSQTKKPKVADCLRKVANWTKVKNTHKFEKSTFKFNEVLDDIPVYSPKMAALLENIEKLDAKDKEQYGTTFKHFIFSDVKQGGVGAKIIASALKASGKVLAYNKDHKLKSDKELLETRNMNFSLLCSTALYNKPITVYTKKAILSKFNERPANIHGDLVRFIVMDGGFKEGIDLFDIKYVHIFEPQTSKADQKQVIGRGTRTCGQRGLKFHPTQGWPLNVYVYDVSVPDDVHNNLKEKLGADTLFKSFMLQKGIDLRQLAFADDLERISIIGSVDYELNKNIHRFEIENDSKYDIFAQGGASSKVKPTSVICETEKCGKRRTHDVPVGNPEFVAVMFGLKRPIPETISSKTSTLKPRALFCSMLKSDRTFCKKVNEIYKDPVAFVKLHAEEIMTCIKRKYHYNLPPSVRTSFLKFIFSILPKPAIFKPLTPFHTPSSPSPQSSPSPSPSPKKMPEEVVEEIHNTPLVPPPPPSNEKMNFLHTRMYVRENFSQYTWSKVTMENKCGPAPEGGAQIMNFTPSQDFLRHYFTPQNPVKGMLAWHSVGTGKTCSAIATATTTFEKQGYTILWVTRTTLKSDIWKNMFDQICSMSIKEKLEKEKDEAARDRMASGDSRMRLLSNAWSIRPMSYKQFSNLVSEKNQLYDDLVKKNGKKDPLRKTLLIIDEAHKLYGGEDLASIERPDMSKLHKALMHSYKTSGQDSVKLLLMTATPITNDPMELIKLINLCRPDKEQITEDFATFRRQYLTPWGTFSRKGSRTFLDIIAGHISYLNRERDARQFAQPIVVPITVPMSSDDGVPGQNFEQQIDTHKTELTTLQTELKTLKKEYTLMKKTECQDVAKDAKPQCIAQVEGRYTNRIQQQEQLIQTKKTELAALKKQYSDFKNTSKDGPSQKSVILNKCV
jgi:superfamily II DNA or RNA helicase